MNCSGKRIPYSKRKDVIRAHYINLIPTGFGPFRVGGGNTVSTNADRFWAPPIKENKSN